MARFSLHSSRSVEPSSICKSGASRISAAASVWRKHPGNGKKKKKGRKKMQKHSHSTRTRWWNFRLAFPRWQGKARQGKYSTLGDKNWACRRWTLPHRQPVALIIHPILSYKLHVFSLPLSVGSIDWDKINWGPCWWLYYGTTERWGWADFC